jgi:hypothetical protein
MTSNTSPLASRLADAALQWLFMRPRSDDLEAEGQGRRHIYAIDSNVVRFIGSPANYAHSQRGTDGGRYLVGFGHVFEDDDKDLSTSIARGLAAFLANGTLSTHAPILLIPPMHLEVEGMIHALIEHEGDTENPEFRATLLDLVEKLSAEGLTAEDAEMLTPQLQALIFENIGPASEARRMARLLVLGTLQPLATAKLPSAIVDIVRPSGFASQLARFSYSEKRDGDDGWISRLSRRSGGWREDLLVNDAEVLARLETWNEALADLERATVGKENWRVLYITSDHRLSAASDDYHSNWFDHSFDRAFLRHPRCFLAEDGVLDVHSTDSGLTARGLTEWFRMLIEPTGEHRSGLELRTLREEWFERRNIPAPLRGMLARFGSVDGDPAPKIKEEWSDFTRQTVALNPPVAFDLPTMSRQERDGASVLQKVKLALHDEIEARRLESLSQYMEAVVQLSFEAEYRAPSTMRARNVVPIYFERWPHAEDLIREVGNWGSEKFDKAEYDAGLARLSKEDPTGYAFYLAHAALFAGRGRWRNASIMAQRAREISERLNYDERGGANGREASYLEAFCIRHGAKTEPQLEGCAALINNAVAAFNRERENHRKLHIDAPGLDVASERFEAERLALDLTKFLFGRYAAGTLVTESDLSKFEEIAEKYWDLKKRLDGRIDSLPTVTTSKNRSVQRTLVDLRRRVQMNLIALGMLDFQPSIIHKLAQAAFGDFLTQNPHFSSQKPGTKTDISLFSRVIVNYAQIRSAHGTQNANNLAREMAKYRATLPKDSLFVFPYDSQRFDEIERMSRQPWPDYGNIAASEGAPTAA